MTIPKLVFKLRPSIMGIFALTLALTVLEPAARAQVRTYYIALDGNDSWSGMVPSPTGSDGPFLTFDHMRTVLEAFIKSGGLTGLSEVDIDVRAGTYFVPHTLTFTTLDSGTASTQIVYQNYPGESPVISGGVQLQSWTNVSGNIWQTPLPASTQYFEQLFYNGERRLRPRLGLTERDDCDQVVDGTPEDTGPNKCRDLGEYFRILNPVILTSAPAPGSIDADNCPLEGSTWECFDRFQYEASPLISSKWKNLNPPSPPPNPNCDASNGSTAPVGDIELLDFEKYTASKLRISCVDTTHDVIYLTGPTSFNTQPSAHGFIQYHRYLIENVQDQLKRPGQWFLDRSNPTAWVLTYLAKKGENPNTDTVIIPQISPVLEASDLQYATFRGLTFENDNYVVPNLGLPDTEIPLQVSAAVSFQNSQNITFDSDIVTQTSGAGLEFLPCTAGVLTKEYINPSPNPNTIRCFGDKVSASGMTANNVVENSAFYDLGEDGVSIGIQSQTSDTVSNVPQYITVENNVVEGYGRVFPNAWGISQGDGHDNVYTQNEVYDGYHAAIGICQCTSIMPPSGGVYNNTISYNLVHHLLQGIMNDAGSLYIAAGNAVFTAAGNSINNNIVHDVNDASALDGWPTESPCPTGLPCDGYGGHGVYLDTQTGLTEVKSNLVYRVSDADLNFPMTPPAPNEANTVENNIFAYARVAAINDGNPYPSMTVPPSPIQTFVADHNIFYFDRSYTSTPSFSVQGGCTYSGGYIYPDYQLWENNVYWWTGGDFTTYADAFHVQQSAATTGAAAPCSFDVHTLDFYTFTGWQAQPPTTTPPISPGEDIGSVVQNPNFANPAYPKDNYRFTAGPPTGFKLLDLDQIGRSNPVINPPPIRGTFVTATFDPATDF